MAVDVAPSPMNEDESENAPELFLPSTSRPNAAVGTAVPMEKWHRRFASVETYVQELAGDKAHVISKILIANNGVAAVKAIRSIRRWAYEVFGDERAITFVVMATPEDLRANAEYIRMGDVIVDVPGGSNNHNYANVTLIVELARLHGVHAVWAGWGHASENPTLPDQLEPAIKFIGPSGAPMRALGDKIGSTIIAQSAGVPCIGWNGSSIRAEYNVAAGQLPAAVYEQATVATATQAEQVAAEIGFPVMIKASEGGGGKGIRRVEEASQVAHAYRQVCGEVPGSPIFIMKLSTNSRHLEVQLLADEYGAAIALNGRDCSVQRRHQKIIEEGPPVAAKSDVWNEMEQAAIALAKAVGYTNAGTVEYLYSETEHKFYFLELNPRLQVEHPVTEMITQVNLPAAQLQVAMGLPLHHIPEIRELYGQHRFEEVDNTDTAIDFTTATRRAPNGHCIAVRITAENAEAGFQPTSGGIQELNFRSTPSVWGYFSMDSSGSIHEFADSQFGHLFATGSDREQARRNMVLALKELSIRGDISTTVDYISKLMELDDYVHNQIDTAWLDGIIQQVSDGTAAESSNTEPQLQRSTSDARRRSSASSGGDAHVHVVVGATILAYDAFQESERQFLELLDKGQLPSRALLKMSRTQELILSSVKYKLQCTCHGPGRFGIAVDNASAEEETRAVTTSVRLLSDGGYLIAIGGQSYVAYVTSRATASTGMRITVGGATVAFSPDYDPSSLRSEVAGKLVKKLVADGAHVKKGESYAELEVMKMFLPLRVEEAGTLSWQANEGAALQAGDLLATVSLDNPENVASVLQFQGSLQVANLQSSAQKASGEKSRPHLLFRQSLEVLQSAMAGFIRTPSEVDQAWEALATAVTSPLLPAFEIEEQLAVLNGRIPAPLFANISIILHEFRQSWAGQATTGIPQKFPAGDILSVMDKFYESVEDAEERQMLISVTELLRKTVVPYTKAKALGVPGAERAMLCFDDMLRKWIAVERWFDKGGNQFSDVVESLRQAHKTEPSTVLSICRAHEQVKGTSGLVVRMLSAISDGNRMEETATATLPLGKLVSVVAGAESLPMVLPVIAEIGAATGDLYAEVALRARKLLMQVNMPSLDRRKEKVLKAAEVVAASQAPESDPSREVRDLLADRFPIVDVLFPLLKSPDITPAVSVGLLELYLRHLYRPYTIKRFERDVSSKVVQFSFLNKPTEGVFSASMSMTSMTDLSRAVSSGSLGKLADSSEDLKQKGADSKAAQSLQIPPSVERTGLCVILDTVESLKSQLPSVLSKIPTASRSDLAGAVNVIYFIVAGSSAAGGEAEEGQLAVECGKVLEPFVGQLSEASIRRVSFVFDRIGNREEESQDESTPILLTFRNPDFKEDALYRHIDPSLASHLGLNRLAANFVLKSLGSRHTAACHVHLYECRPKPSALSKDKWAKKDPRVFARALSFEMDFSSSSFERILVDALNALDLCSLKNTSDNHLFLSLVSDFERNVLDPVVVEQIVAGVVKRHSHRISGLGIVEVETRIVCCLSADSPPIAIRLFSSNPTGFVQVMNTYVEASSETSVGERVYKLIGGTKASLASSGDSSWDGLNVNTPYPLTRPFDAQRKAALRSSDTVYCYDLPALFEAAVEQQWQQAAADRNQASNVVASRPLMVMYTTELVVKKKNGLPGKWTMQDYSAGNLELVEENRGAGHNDVGMVAWLVTLRTVEYPNGRQVILIANDITVKAGSFGTREDVVFKMASDLAREKRVPRLFIAANSGARIGLADAVKRAYKVAFKDTSKPENGFDFLYLEKEHYEKYASDVPEVRCELTTYEGREVYRLTDIIGSEPDLGVENLKGSGLIAGETSVAYRNVFTMTVVLGRTVGIGAYLVRLGHRTIQKTSAAPIILTGYQALNKLMGVDVYSTNEQIGGPGIMYVNGISHQVAQDHLLAVKAAVDWLSYVPSTRGGLLPVTDIRGIDDVERPIAFAPMAGTPYDPRHLLAGYVREEDDSWVSGFFDRGSFTESLAGWAKTVVVGRARLGGIPMGVIITENRTVEAVRPADPADLKASESVMQEAGCVWFPNSAYKTAQSINDFRVEDLPLMVFANWRGFSGGQRDMFEEVLKYGSMIVDAFSSYQQPVFIFIPPFGEIRGGAWVVLDASINAAVMEMYAAKGTARGGVLEANGAASVKYRTRDLLATMHRLDASLQELDQQLAAATTGNEAETEALSRQIAAREQQLLPVYEQISVQFCELHDTPGRMKAVGVIEKEVEWRTSRAFFYWRLRRKLAEFDLRRQLMQAAKLGRGVKALTASQASGMIYEWFLATTTASATTKAGNTSSAAAAELWTNDKAVLSWMAEHHADLEQRILTFNQQVVAEEICTVMTAGGNTAQVGIAGIVEGLSRGLSQLPPEEQARVRDMILQSLNN